MTLIRKQGRMPGKGTPPFFISSRPGWSSRARLSRRPPADPADLPPIKIPSMRAASQPPDLPAGFLNCWHSPTAGNIIASAV